MGRAVAESATDPADVTAVFRTPDRVRVLDPTRTAVLRVGSDWRVPSTSTMRLGRRRTVLPAPAAEVPAAPTTRRWGAARDERPRPCVVRVTPLEAGARWRVLVDDAVDLVPEAVTRFTERVGLFVPDR